MSHLYHQVPQDMQGTVLYPLNQLKHTHPDLYVPKTEKYVGREYILEQIIPPLSCLWNDVIFLTAVHPQQIADAFASIGQSFAGRKYFKIDPSTLDPKHAVVYLYQHRRKEDDLADWNFEKFDPDLLDQYSQLPQETADYFAEMFAKDKRPLLYHRVPHILYHGTIDTSGLEIIET